MIVLRTTDASHNAEVSAAIDRMFANSENPTISQSDREWQSASVSQTMNVGLMVNIVVGASLFTLLLLTGNSMMNSVRLRTPELAVLKTIGFSDTKIFFLVVTESGVLCVLGALLGLVAARSMFPMIADAVSLRGISMPLRVAVTGVTVSIFTAFASAGLPALRAMRLSVVDALFNRQ